MLETFTGIFSNKISCWRKLDFEFYSGDGVMASVKSSKKVPTELMPAPLSLYLRDIKEYDSALYVQFELNENTKGAKRMGTKHRRRRRMLTSLWTPLQTF